MRLNQIDLYRLQIPLSMPVRHNLAARRLTVSLVVKVTTKAGLVGFGEGIARRYVTGETTKSSLRFLRDYLIPQVNGFRAEGPEELMKELDGLLTAESRAQAPAACCALELAILDAAGKSWGQPLGALLGRVDQPLIYSGVIPMLDRSSFLRALNVARDLNMTFLKIKVGGEHDLDLLSLTREELGDNVDLRVDANGAWSADAAERNVASMMPYRISAVEQPVAKDDIQGLKRLAECAPVPVIADESLCTERDAELLASLGACQVFNIRLSKCGGLLTALRLYRIARNKGITVQLGCQVGETGILAAAGRHLASCLELLHLEGSYSKYILMEDIVNEPVEFGSGGVAQPLSGFGLGVIVNEEALQRLATMRRVIRL